MKGLTIAVVCIILLIVVVSGVFFIKSAVNTPPVIDNPSNIVLLSGESNYNNPVASIPTESYDKQSVSYEFKQDVAMGNYTPKTYNKEDFPDEVDKHPNINSATSSFGQYSYTFDTPSEDYLKNVPSPINGETFFKEDKEILPSMLVLQDDSQKAYYRFNDKIYYIPVVKCDSLEEECIVYQDYGLTIMKNTGRIFCFNKEININYGDKEINFGGVFEGYFLKDDKAEHSQIRMFATNLDRNDNTDEIVITVNAPSSISDYGLCKAVILKKDNSIDLALVPNDIGSNILRSCNLFYANSNNMFLTINDVSDEYVFLDFYEFDNGFKKVMRYSSASDVENLILNQFYTNSKDLNLKLSDLDSSFNESFSGDIDSPDYIKYYISKNPQDFDAKLPKGAVMQVVKVLDNVGHVVVNVQSSDIITIDKNEFLPQTSVNIILGDNK